MKTAEYKQGLVDGVAVALEGIDYIVDAMDPERIPENVRTDEHRQAHKTAEYVAKSVRGMLSGTMAGIPGLPEPDEALVRQFKRVSAVSLAVLDQEVAKVADEMKAAILEDLPSEGGASSDG